MKKALLILLLVSNTAFAWNWEDPNSKFDATKNEVNKINIDWRQVDDIDKACNAERKKRGKAVFSFQVQACSFWVENQCVILTPKMTSIHTLGHEALHCFKVSYH